MGISLSAPTLGKPPAKSGGAPAGGGGGEKEEPKKDLPPPPPPPPKVDQVKFVKPVVAKAEEVTEEPPKITEIKDKKLGNETIKGDPDAELTVEPVGNGPADIVDDNNIFDGGILTAPISSEYSFTIFTSLQIIIYNILQYYFKYSSINQYFIDKFCK